jgi:hypothetical protein
MASPWDTPAAHHRRRAPELLRVTIWTDRSVSVSSDVSGIEPDRLANVLRAMADGLEAGTLTWVDDPFR